MRRLSALALSGALAASMLATFAAPVAATPCTPTGYVRDGINLTAALIDPTSPVTGEVDATGCNIGVYFGSGTGLVRDADIHGANYFGVVVNGARVDITDSAVHDIGETPFNGTQHGNAIYYAYGSTSSGKVSENRVWNYQKGGIVASGSGVSVTVSENTVTGFGPVTFIAQNGIQVSYGAQAVVEDNRVSANQYAPQTWASAGILLYQAGAVTVTDNHVTSNDVGIYAVGTDDGVTIEDNDVSGSTFDGITFDTATGGRITGNRAHENGTTGGPGIGLYGTTGATVNENAAWGNSMDGIFVDGGSTANVLEENKARGNTGFDCEDGSTGAGTAGTANAWNDNRGATSSPAGLCTQASGDNHSHD